jgi:hypothetical protein
LFVAAFFIANCTTKYYSMGLYRILSFFVNFFCAFLAVITAVGLMVSLSNPAGLLQVFLMASVVLYGWFANKFYLEVIMKLQKMSKKQKDWLQVNGIVALVFSILGISNSIYIYYNPDTFDDLLSEMPEKIADPHQMLINVATVLLVFCALLLVHIIWTYKLVKKHADSFEG